MKIGIVGTRGIPNHYGGFEQFAHNFSLFLVHQGHDVWVYNSSLHPYKENTFEGVKLIHKYDPENKIGTAGQFVYDFLCIIDSRKRAFDVILQLGYTSSSVFSFLFPVNSKLITNMDGLEWKRSKYSKNVQNYLLHAEKWAVKYSDLLISDSLGIQEYLMEKYTCPSSYIPYSAELFDNPEESILSKYQLTKYNYNILIARMEPENNIELIILSHLQKKGDIPLMVIGSYSNDFGTTLYTKYNSDQVRFTGAIYDQTELNNLRYYSNIYFHGHSVGGTNPSLIEAMACNCLIVAHNNIFNKSILGTDAFYFENVESLNSILDKKIEKKAYSSFLDNNLKKIKEVYNPERIFKMTEDLFNKALSRVN